MSENTFLRQHQDHHGCRTEEGTPLDETSCGDEYGSPKVETVLEVGTDTQDQSAQGQSGPAEGHEAAVDGKLAEPATCS